MARKRGIKAMFDLGRIASVVMNNLSFVLFLGFLVMVYIANAHLAERNVRKIQTIQKELKEMRWYYMSLQSDNMYNAKRTEVAKRVKDNGLRAHREAPKRVIINREEH